jgi:hypothetical protein
MPMPAVMTEHSPQRQNEEEREEEEVAAADEEHQRSEHEAIDREAHQRPGSGGLLRSSVTAVSWLASETAPAIRVPISTTM